MISTDEYLDYCDRALDQIAAVAQSLGDGLINSVLPASGNSVYGLITHCEGVMARWGRTVNRGIVIPRDRDAEFTATGTVAQALATLERGRQRLHEDVAATSNPRERPINPPSGREVGTQGSVLFHIYEELAQHLGHMEVIRDVLLESASPPATA